MQHMGDISTIHGRDVPPVDCIIGGSPCQDLSVAGKRAGLDGDRSGLFMEQIRIVREMRENHGTAYILRPCDMALNCAANRRSFDGVKERMY